MSDLGPGSRPWSPSVSMRGEGDRSWVRAGQTLSDGQLQSLWPASLISLRTRSMVTHGALGLSCWQALGGAPEVWLLVAHRSTLSCSYWVSCRLEPAHQKASKMRLFRRKRNRTSSSSGPSECWDQEQLNPGAQYSFRLSKGLDPSSTADQAWDGLLPSPLWDSVASSEMGDAK